MEESELRAQLEEHHAASYGWALHCCSRAPELAEDVLQMAYLKILQGRARYRGGSAFKTWLFGVIRLTAADQRRRRWLHGLLSAGYQREQASVEWPEAGSQLDESARWRAFGQALARLPRRQQEIMHLVLYQELSLQEACAVMGVSLGSARKHYERGKRSLHAWLDKSEYFDEYRKQRPTAQGAV